MPAERSEAMLSAEMRAECAASTDRSPRTVTSLSVTVACDSPSTRLVAISPLNAKLTPIRPSEPWSVLAVPVASAVTVADSSAPMVASPPTFSTASSTLAIVLARASLRTATPPTAARPAVLARFTDEVMDDSSCAVRSKSPPTATSTVRSRPVAGISPEPRRA